MKTKILFFGTTATDAGMRETEIDLEDGESVSSFLERITMQNPRLANHKLLIAVNEEYAELDAILKEGDEVAVFTAVSGG
ncbi:MAG: MoaD/ThiS family protein [Pyrinomonadaceae bacterium]|nr:MoaD/ThiS family protein [Blastocatellia bacterium]MDQ3221189.1 MoaD/ThiS family protein [Acidobacteriota bacterium]MDQ3491050.1 MoaD/ThiS family protein [Acidobacteriota bacterium]